MALDLERALHDKEHAKRVQAALRYALRAVLTDAEITPCVHANLVQIRHVLPPQPQAPGKRWH